MSAEPNRAAEVFIDWCLRPNTEGDPPPLGSYVPISRRDDPYWVEWGRQFVDALSSAGLAVVAQEDDRPRITREEVAAKLAEMWLHDNTGDPRDEGYMAALTEFSDWMKSLAARRLSAAGEVPKYGEKW